MNPLPEQPDELLRLLSTLEDGTLESSEVARLAELLQADPAARKRYYRHAMLAALLRREGRRTAAQCEETAATPRVPTVSAGGRRLWWVGLAATVLLMLAFSVGEATGLTQFVPTIVRVVTGEGSLVIEVDDPAVSVTLDGEDVTIKGAGIHELRLRPGTHKFVTIKDGQPLREEVVTIERGGRQVVKVSREGSGGASGNGDTTGGRFRELTGHHSPIWNVALVDGLAISAGEDHWVRVWNVQSGQEVQRFDGHDSAIYALAVSPDGKRALSGSGCYLLSKVEDITWSVCLWEIETGRELRRLEGRGPGITSVAFSPDGNRALVGSYDGVVRLWDVNGWQEIRQFPVSHGLWSICFSPDGTQALTAGGDGTQGVIRLWSLADGEEVQRYVGHKFGAWDAVFLPDGQSLLSAGQDGTVRQWNTDTGEQIRMFPHEAQVTRIALSADGQWLLAGTFTDRSHPNLWLWNLAKPNEQRALPGIDDSVIAVALSGDATLAVAAGNSGRLGLWALPPPTAASPASTGQRVAPD